MGLFRKRNKSKKKPKKGLFKKIIRGVGDIGKFAINTATSPVRQGINLLNGKKPAPQIGRYNTKMGKGLQKASNVIGGVALAAAGGKFLATGGAIKGIAAGIKKVSPFVKKAAPKVKALLKPDTGKKAVNSLLSGNSLLDVSKGIVSDHILSKNTTAQTTASTQPATQKAEEKTFFEKFQGFIFGGVGLIILLFAIIIIRKK